jgi:hypothetical protein
MILAVDFFLHRIVGFLKKDEEGREKREKTVKFSSADLKSVSQPISIFISSFQSKHNSLAVCITKQDKHHS